MARPNKVGLEYFSLDVKMDDEVELIKAQHGIKGFGILITMFQTIYADKGYYRTWNKRNQLLFSNKVSDDVNSITTIIDDCINWDIFDKVMYENYNILTSRRIQKQYIGATYKRTEVEIIEEYLLIKKNNRENITYITVSDNGNLDTTNVSDSKSTQSIRIKDKDKNKDKNKEHCPAEKKQDIPYKEIVKYLNKKIDSRYKSTTNKTKKLIKARWNEGFRLDDFKTVIDKKCVEWMGDKEMEKYLRPPTLFSNKFESYLNQLSVENENKGGNDNRNSERNNRNEQQKDYTAGAPEGFFKD